MSLTPPDSTSPVIAPKTRTKSDRSSAKISTSKVSAKGAPTLAPGVASITHLTNRLAEYLTPSELKTIREAYRFSDEAHLGQMRVSGEPYISHPIAVAEICADWKLDAQAIMAALLHDEIGRANV